MDLALGSLLAVSLASGAYLCFRLPLMIISLLLFKIIRARRVRLVIIKYLAPVLTLTLTFCLIILSVQVFDIVTKNEYFYHPIAFLCYFLITVYLFYLEALFQYRSLNFSFVKKEEERSLLIN